MRIAYLSRGSGGRHGDSTYDRLFLSKMVEKGYEVYFISYWPGERVKVQGVKNLHFDIITMHSFRRMLMIQTALHLRKLLKKIKPDILHTGWIQDHGFLGALSGFHPTLSMPWGSDVLIKPDQSRLLKWITQFTLKQADMITCDCELVKKKIIELIGCVSPKITVFPWGIDLSVFKLYPNASNQLRERLGWENKLILIMTRLFEPIYGIEFFINALPDVIRKQPNARVVFLNIGSLLNDCRKKINELGLDRYVYFAGRVDRITVAHYLNLADIYVNTSLSDGTSCSLLEAMACGLPVITSDVPSYFEWVEDGVNGYIVPRRDSEILADRIIQLLDAELTRKKMSERNIQIANERADWEKNFGKLENIYQKLLSTSRANLLKG